MHLVSGGQTLVLSARCLSIEYVYKRLAARVFGIVQSCSDTLSFFRVIVKHLVRLSQGVVTTMIALLLPGSNEIKESRRARK